GLRLVPMERLTRVVPLFLPDLDVELSEHLTTETLAAECPIANVRKPPAAIEHFQRPEQFAGDNIFARGPNDERATKPSLSCRFAQAASLPIQFTEHAIASAWLVPSTS